MAPPLASDTGLVLESCYVGRRKTKARWIGCVQRMLPDLAVLTVDARQLWPLVTPVLSGWIHEELVHDRFKGLSMGPLLLDKDGLYRLTLDTDADVPFPVLMCDLQGDRDKHVNPVLTNELLRSV